MKTVSIWIVTLSLLAGATESKLLNGYEQIDKFGGLEDFSWVPRALSKTPEFKSEKVRYSIWVLGDGKKSVMTMAWDESEGTGKGYDTLYVDKNFNGDLTEEGEKYFWSNHAKEKDKNAFFERYEVKNVKEADGNKVFAFEFMSADSADEFHYPSDFKVSWPGGGYSTNCLPGNLNVKWSNDLKTAPVYRFGGAAVPIPNKKMAGQDFGVFTAGDEMNVDYAVAQFGNDLGVKLLLIGSHLGGGKRPETFLRVLKSDGALVEDIPFVGGCGCAGSYCQKLLIPSRVPPGKHVLVSRVNRPDYLGGKAEYLYPIVIENPEYGKPLADPAFIALKQKNLSPQVRFASLRKAEDKLQMARSYPEENIVPAPTADNCMIDGDAKKFEYPGWESHASDRTLGLGSLWAEGRDFMHHSLLKFDLNAIPKETKIVGACLRLTVVQTEQWAHGKPGCRIEVYPLRRDWTEAAPDITKFGYSCWFGPKFIMHGNPKRELWGAPGADDPNVDRFPECASAEVNEFPAKLDPASKDPKAPREKRRMVSMDVTDIVKKWQSGEVPNNGWVLKLAGKERVMICSSKFQDYPLRPTLVIAYEGAEIAAAVLPEDGLQAVVEAAKKSNKPILVKFYSPLCATCKKVSQTTFEAPEVKAALGGYEFASLAVEDNAAIAAKFGVTVVPTVVVLTPGGVLKDKGTIQSDMLRDSQTFLNALKELK